MLLLQQGQNSIHNETMSMDPRLYEGHNCEIDPMSYSPEYSSGNTCSGYAPYVANVSPETSPPPAYVEGQGYPAMSFASNDYPSNTTSNYSQSYAHTYVEQEYPSYDPQSYYRNAYYTDYAPPYDCGTPIAGQERYDSRGYAENTAPSSQSSSTPSSPRQNYTNNMALPNMAMETVMQRNKSAIPESRQKPCAVCGDNAACQHYGVRTCEGCKGFFKRTVQKASKYVCLSNKTCTVDKRRRNRCQFCRFQKCLDVGMVKEVVRTASLKGRRGRLPSKPRSPANIAFTNEITKAHNSSMHSLSSILVSANLSTQPNAMNIDYSMYSEMQSADVKCETNGNHVRDIVSESMQRIRAWTYHIPCYGELCQADQNTLFDAAAPDLLALRVGNRLTIEGDRLLFCNGVVLHRTQCLSTLGSLTDNILVLGRSLKNLEIDEVAFSCLLALSLITNRAGLLDAPKVEEFEMRIIDTLRDHCKFNQQCNPQYFQQVMAILNDIRIHNNELVTVSNRPNDKFAVDCLI